MSETNTSLPTGAGLQGIPSSTSADTPAFGSEAAPLRGVRSRRFASILQWAFSFPAMLGTFLVGRVFYEARSFAVDPDLWWHVRVGQDILHTHHWPTTDPFSFTVAGTPWLAYEWLGDVLIGGVARYGGLLGLDILLIVLASIIIITLYAFTSMRSGNSKAGFVASGLLCSLAFASFNLRPQMLGYLFLILALIALERFRQGKPRALSFLPLLFLLWINAHGSWVIGLGVIVVYWASGLFEFQLGGIEATRWSAAQRIRLELIFLLCLAAIPLTPYGTRLAAYPFTVASSLPLNLGNILEWQSMPFNIAGGKLFLVLILAFFLAQMLFQPKWKLAEVLLCFGGIAMACLHVRFLLLFVPFFAPLFATLLARWLPAYNTKKDLRLFNALLMAVVIAAMVRYFPTRAGITKIAAETYPVHAVEYLRLHPVPGPMFNSYGYGGYLVWMLPEQKVFIDGRGDLYEDGGAFGEYLEVADLKPGAFAILRAHGIQFCLLERKDALSTVLAANPDWELRYTDGVSAVFVRRKPYPSQDSGRTEAAEIRGEQAGSSQNP